MMPALKEIKDSFLHLLFPHNCSGCGSDVISEKSTLCAKCISEMPATNFHFFESNPVERIFWGRLPIANATAQFYFTKESLMQRLMHELKYKGNRELGLHLGGIMGNDLKQAPRFCQINALVPLPLFPSKERRRGYNQAAVLCEGIGRVMGLPVLNKTIIRTEHTETQTRKGRIERWQNMEGKFQLTDAEKVKNQHLLLVDDVITTGATLEACGRELLKPGDTRLSIATLCFASR